MTSLAATDSSSILVGESTVIQSRTSDGGPQPLLGKRVAIVVLSSYPQDPRPRRIADSLQQEGMEVDYICASDGKAPSSERVNGINVLRIPIVHQRGGKFSYILEYSAFILASAAILVKQSMKHRYDLVYINNMPDVLVASALIPKMFGAKVILDLHDPMPELMTTIFGVNPKSATARLIKWLEKWSMARADQVLTVNIACHRIFSGRSCAAEKIGVVMNSPDERIFPFRVSRPSADTGGGARPLVVMYHGSLVERNGVDLAVEALLRVPEGTAPLQLHVYGKSTPFWEKVMKSVKARGVENRVLYFGQKSMEGIVEAIDKCDVGVVPNHRNSFTDINTPTRIFEYLALGKPVIAPSTRGIQDYFGPESLFFFEPGDATDLAKQIAFVSGHREKLAETVLKGQEVYQAHTWTQERNTLVDIVNRLLVGQPLAS